MQHNQIALSLNIPKSKKYYLTLQDKKNFPVVLEKFKNFMTYYHGSEFIDYIDLSKTDITCSDDEIIIFISTQYTENHSIDSKKFFRVVLWDDQTWGKLEIFNVMHSNEKFDRKFCKNKFREMVSKKIGTQKLEIKSIGQYYIGRMIPRIGIQHRIPVLFKKDENIFQDRIYGHPMGYARNLVYYDLTFRKKFKAVFDRLNDQRSKNIFKLVSYGRVSDIWQYYFDSILENPQYLDYITLDSKSVVLNLGVEAGFEIPAFLAMGCQKIFCVDPGGSSQLGEYARVWANDYSDRLCFIEKWLYKSAASNASNSVKDQADVTTLLDIVKEQKIKKIDLVKSDIEGAERLMLDDLISLAKTNRPQFAISIYHTQFDDRAKSPVSDLVDIPLTLMNQLENYHFYIGFYSFERWEVVLYCIPRERENN